MLTTSKHRIVSSSLISGALISGLIFGISACSSSPKVGQKTNEKTVISSDAEQASGGGVATSGMPIAPPVIANPRVVPNVVILGPRLDAAQPVNVYVDIKSLGSNLDKVKLRLYFASDTDQRLKFFERPVSVDMKHLEGSTWRAELSDNELKKLAINGESLKYEGHIIAQNDQGQTTVSSETITFTIQAPLVMEKKG